MESLQQPSDKYCVICFGKAKTKNIATSTEELNRVFNNCITFLENIIVIEPYANEAGLIFCDLCLDFESNTAKFTEHISSLQKKIVNLTIAFSAGVVHRRNKFFEGKKSTDGVAENTIGREIHISESNDESILQTDPSPSTTREIKIQNVQQVIESPSSDNPLSESLNEAVNERQPFDNAIGEANPENIENNLADSNVENSKNKDVDSELMKTVKTPYILLKRISLDTTKRPETVCGNSYENNSPLKKNYTEHYCYQPNAGPRRSKSRGIKLNRTASQISLFKCPNCPKSFPFQSVLSLHLKKHCKQKTRQCATTKRTVHTNDKKIIRKKGREKLPCSLCQKLVAPSYLERHKHDHTREENYQCEICGKKFMTPSRLKAHKIIHSHVKAYKCNICERAFRRKSNLKIHEVVHTNVRAFKCGVCDKTFRQKSNLNSHAVIHTEGRGQKCSFCHKIYCTAKYLKLHEKIHREGSEYKCEFCKKSFTDFQQLDRHTRSHTREKPYKCSFCEKAFSYGTKRKYHERIHSEQYLYECSFCKKKCRWFQQLNSHLRFHTREKPYKCSCCEKTFSCGNTMRYHERSHSGQYCYECSFCKKGFNFRTNFESHVRRHVGERPYICAVCKKEFSQLVQLKNHEKIHATETQGNTF